jgi:hypothetical protein
VWPYTMLFEFWMRTWMLPLQIMGSGVPSPATSGKATRETEEYLVAELRADLEVQGVQGIIDEGGRP